MIKTTDRQMDFMWKQIKLIQNLCSEAVNGISSMIERLEKVISSPLDNILNVVEFPSSFILSTILNDTPAQHGHGKSHREVELNRISSIIVPTWQILEKCVTLIAVPCARVTPPRHIVMFWKLPSCNYQIHRTKTKERQSKHPNIQRPIRTIS